MERERPEYLPPIPRSRWEFPWLGILAVLLLTLAGAGVWLHLKTSDAWNQRFVTGNSADTLPKQVAPEAKPQQVATQEQMQLLERRVRHARAEARMREQEDLRCINGILFRRIPGGWENLPGQTCP